MFLKRLFYASASILMLAAAYHLGASNATAQAPNNSLVGLAGVSSTVVVATANGDLYAWQGPGVGWQRYGTNVFSGATSVQSESFGALKARYR